MNAETAVESPLEFTSAAAAKVAELIKDEGNPGLMLRVYIQGGGCSGFQYGFTFDENLQDGDTEVMRDGVKLLIDPMSMQYLTGAEIDYTGRGCRALSSSSAIPTPLRPAVADRPSPFRRIQGQERRAPNWRSATSLLLVGGLRLGRRSAHRQRASATTISLTVCSRLAGQRFGDSPEFLHLLGRQRIRDRCLYGKRITVNARFVGISAGGASVNVHGPGCFLSGSEWGGSASGMISEPVSGSTACSCQGMPPWTMP